jgi:uncharacterized protein YuzE
MNLRVTVDRSANTVYVYLREIGPGDVARTVACEDVPIHLNLDKNGHRIGIEVLNATKLLPSSVIHRAERL